MNKDNAIKQLEMSLKELAIFKKYKCDIGVSDKQALNLVEKSLTPTSPDEVKDNRLFHMYYDNMEASDKQ